MVSPSATAASIWEVLKTVEDPELPISITDLGLVGDVKVAGDRVLICLVPTWVGCPALDVIRDRVSQAVGALPGVQRADVEYVYERPWTLDRMTERGRDRLKEYGLAVPRCRFAEPAVCPYCGSQDVVLESLFGPTRCRSTYLCRGCRNPFERFKPPA